MTGVSSSGGNSGAIHGRGDGGGAESKLSDIARMISGALEDWGSSTLRLRYDLLAAVGVLTPIPLRLGLGRPGSGGPIH